MKRNQFIICFLSIFSINFLYASPVKDLKDTNNNIIENSCLITTFNEMLENNIYREQSLNINDILNYKCSAGIEPTVVIDSVNRWNIWNDESLISYPDINFTNEKLAEYNSIVVVTSIF